MSKTNNERLQEIAEGMQNLNAVWLLSNKP